LFGTVGKIIVPIASYEISSKLQYSVGCIKLITILIWRKFLLFFCFEYKSCSCSKLGLILSEHQNLSWVQTCLYENTVSKLEFLSKLKGFSCCICWFCCFSINRLFILVFVFRVICANERRSEGGVVSHGLIVASITNYHGPRLQDLPR